MANSIQKLDTRLQKLEYEDNATSILNKKIEKIQYEESVMKTKLRKLDVKLSTYIQSKRNKDLIAKTFRGLRDETHKSHQMKIKCK